MKYLKKTLEQGEGEIKETVQEYQVDGEVGRFKFKTHCLEKEGKIIYDTSRSFFPALKGKEWYKTIGFKEIAMVYGAIERSYRKVRKLINRIRYQEGATPLRTLAESVGVEGSKIIDFIEYKANNILGSNNFTQEGTPKDNTIEYGSIKGPEVPYFSEKEGSGFIAGIIRDEVEKGVKANLFTEEVCSEIVKNPVIYENPSNTIDIIVDDVGAKKQKEIRKSEKVEEDSTSEGKYVYNTIAHIEKVDSSYTLNERSTVRILPVLIAFLLSNNLLDYRLQFFLDGQRTLQAAILKAFSWHKNIAIILDWFHLEEKCKMQLSMALKGRIIKQEILEQLMPLLWYGLLDRAIALLMSIDKNLIKDESKLQVLIGYFERNRKYIPCYVIRNKLGLRNSSNIGEKMNDLIVSERQKHNGMSWSKSGSVALASITTMVRNNEQDNWFKNKNIEFKIAA